MEERGFADVVLGGPLPGVVAAGRQEFLHRVAVREENPPVIRLWIGRRRHPPNMRERVLHSNPFDVHPLGGTRQASRVIAHKLLAEVKPAGVEQTKERLDRKR